MVGKSRNGRAGKYPDKLVFRNVGQVVKSHGLKLGTRKKLFFAGPRSIAIKRTNLLANIAAKEAWAFFLFVVLCLLNDVGRDVAGVLNGQVAKALAGIQEARLR